MKKSGQALGNVTRQANKKLRRERIFNLAKRLIAAKGLEDFTISELADEAGVTTPTIHNLFGKKSDIVKELVSNLIELMQGMLPSTRQSNLLKMQSSSSITWLLHSRKIRIFIAPHLCQWQTIKTA